MKKYIIFILAYFMCEKSTIAQTCTGIDVPAMSTDASYSGYTELPTGVDYNTASANYKVTGNTSVGGFNFSQPNITIVVLSGAKLTLGNYNANEGPINIIVQYGGILDINQGDLKGNSAAKPLNYTVYGTLTRTGSLTMQNSARLLVAGTGGVTVSGLFDMAGGSADVVIEGSVRAGSATIQSNNICMDKNGCMNVIGDFTMNTTSAFVNPTDGTETGYLKLDKNEGEKFLNNGVSLSTKLTVCTHASSCYRINSGTAGYTAGSGCTSGQNSPWPNVALNTAACTSPAAAKCNGAVPLPIRLAFFNTELTNEGVMLKWGTYGQWDSDYLLVEKSRDGLSWEYVNTTPALNNANRYEEYLIGDPNPFKGDSYYRLVEIDTKGNRTIYAVDFVHNDNSFRGFSIYPNPSNGAFIVNISGDFPRYDMTLLDVTGRNLGTYIFSSGKNEINTELPTGVYLAKLKIGYDYYTQKIIVQ